MKKTNKKSKNEQIIMQYEQLRPLYVQLTSKVKKLLEEIMLINGIKFHAIEGRTKDIYSLREKLVRKSGKYIDPINEITDFTGIRIITYFLDDVKKITDLIIKEFEVDYENSMDQGNLLNENEFGYRSMHYVVSLSKARTNLTEWSNLSNKKFEIQIRTVLQHAWAGISHTLQYKHEREVPSSLKRQMFRLAGLFEIADEEFIDIREQHIKITSQVNEVTLNLSTVEINIHTIQNFLINSPIVKYIHDSAEEIGYLFEDPFEPDEREDDDKFNSIIVNYCEHVDINSIGDLEAFLSNNKAKAIGLLQEQFEASDSGEWVVSDSFLICLVIISILHKKFTLTTLIRLGWHETLAERVLHVANGFGVSQDEGDIA